MAFAMHQGLTVILGMRLHFERGQAPDKAFGEALHIGIL